MGGSPAQGSKGPGLAGPEPGRMPELKADGRARGSIALFAAGRPGTATLQSAYTGRGPRKEKEKEKPGTIRVLAGAFGPGASTRKSLQGNFPGDTRRGGATSWLLTQAAPQFPPWCRPRARAR